VTIRPITAFDSIAQRIVYGLKLMVSDFAPIESDQADERGQRNLHRLMGQLLDRLYESPGLLSLPDHPDEAYAWYEVNNSNPELDQSYKSVFKCLYDFYKFLFLSFLLGELRGDSLSACNAVLKANKTRCMPRYQALLKEVGISLETGKTETTLTAEPEILVSLKLLAERTPVNTNPWTPYALINFVCCSFTGDFSYLITRVDQVKGLNGLLPELQSICLDKGYTQDILCSFSPSGFEFRITFRKRVGGFIVGYNPRKYGQFYFGSLNSIGIKAMLEDYKNLDQDLLKHLISASKTCDGCLTCTKGGRNKVYAVQVAYEGKSYTLCPDHYGRHSWETLNRDLAGVLFQLNAAQELYGSDWKTK
jgi:hypothetical protein